jgi:hypothetical protein
MVTSFRPKCPEIRDDTVLTTVRPVSDLNELYSQFAEYRLEILEERIRSQLKVLREAKTGVKKLPTDKLKYFLREQESFLAHMNKEIVLEDSVPLGEIDDSHLTTTSESKVDKRPKKRVRRNH